MELRHLKYFVAVAEELHFGRAARRLNLAQPPLSQQIRSLEEELGGRLFTRTSRKVELTESGRLFLEQARLILAQADKAGHAVRAAHRGEAGRITIGFVTSAVYTLVPTILREFNRGRPHVEIRCFEMNSNEQRVALQDRRIEVGFNRAPLADAMMHVEILARERFVLALPSDHPRARDRKLRLRQFAGDGFIQFSRDQGNVIYDGVIASCHRAGFSPRIAQESTGVQTTLALVAAGLGVAMVPASLQQLRRPGVTYRELPPVDSQELELALVWRKGETSAVIDTFVKIAREVARRAANA